MKKLLLKGLVGIVILFIFGCSSMDNKKDFIKPYDYYTSSTLYMTSITGNTANIFLFSEINNAMSISIKRDFITLENLDIKNVNFYINDSGGSVTASLSIIDTILKYKKIGWSINIYASGMVASAAVPIFASGDERIASKQVIFMLHPLKTRGTSNNLDVLEKLCYDKYINSLMKYTKLSYNEWMEKIKVTTWFGSEDALKWGLITDIQ